MARTRLLPHDSIAVAAFELVDAEGAGALTIARLADRLGVAQMTLYNYAAGKQEIVNMLPDVLLADLLSLSSCPSLERVAADVRLGHSPLPGSPRILDGAEVRSLRRSSG